MGTTRHSLDDDMLGGGPSFNTDRYTSSVYDRCVYCILYTKMCTLCWPYIAHTFKFQQYNVGYTKKDCVFD